jgi:hypothetical protein
MNARKDLNDRATRKRMIKQYVKDAASTRGIYGLECSVLTIAGFKTYQLSGHWRLPD